MAMVVRFGNVNLEEHVPEPVVNYSVNWDVMEQYRRLVLHSGRLGRGGPVELDSLASVVDREGETVLGL
eukprot:711727-Amorphochlora_amoeboformis.AAC.1